MVLITIILCGLIMPRVFRALAEIFGTSNYRRDR